MKASAIRPFLKGVFSLRLLGCAAVIVVFHLLMDVGNWGGSETCVWNKMCLATMGGTGYLFWLILPAIPYAISLAEDWKSHAVPYWAVRTGIDRYVSFKLIASAVSGFLTIFIGYWLYALIDGLFHPWYLYSPMDSFKFYAENGQVWLTFMTYIIYRSFSGALVAVLGFTVSTFIPNPYIAAASPLAIFMVIRRLVNGMDQNTLRNPTVWFVGIHLSSNDAAVVIEKAVLTVILCIVLEMAAVLAMRRRFQHA